jgi:hypothetical protein
MLITESQLRNDTKEQRFTVLVEKAIGEALEVKLYIFISHKHNEDEFVYRLKDILERYGYGGYVDWEDEDMPPITSGDTALKLKERIKKAKKFIFIATEAAIESKWCNWEVGFADAHKYEDHIALFPVKKDFGNYKGEEYLQIYPSIQVKRQNNERSFDYYVRYPGGKEMPLRNWLTA